MKTLQGSVVLLFDKTAFLMIFAAICPITSSSKIDVVGVPAFFNVGCIYLLLALVSMFTGFIAYNRGCGTRGLLWI